MGKNLSDFADIKITGDEVEKKLKENNINTDNLKDNIKKYQNLTQQELMQEFIAVTKNQKQNGEIDNNKLNSMIENLSPYINTQQKEFLQSLIRKTDE